MELVPLEVMLETSRGPWGPLCYDGGWHGGDRKGAILRRPCGNDARSSLHGLYMCQTYLSGLGPSSWEGPADVTLYS